MPENRKSSCLLEPPAKGAHAATPRDERLETATPTNASGSWRRIQSEPPVSSSPRSPAFGRKMADFAGDTSPEIHDFGEDAQPYIWVTDPDVVRVCVGPEKRLYLWHRKLLCAESPSVARRLERRRAWEVSVGRTPTVPTAKISDRVEAVAVVTKWLYDHEVVMPTKGSLIFDAYVCAVKLDLERLQNRIMDDLRKLDMNPKGAELDDLVELLIQFNGGSSTMPMRNSLFDLAVSALRQPRKPFSNLDDGTREKLLKHQGLMKDLLLELKAMRMMWKISAGNGDDDTISIPMETAAIASVARRG